MGVIDQIQDFENMPLSSLASVLVRWYNFVSVNVKTEFRPEVASRIWMTVELVEVDGEVPMYISGQTNQIVSRRMIEYLDSKNVRSNKPQKIDA